MKLDLRFKLTSGLLLEDEKAIVLLYCNENEMFEYTLDDVESETLRAFRARGGVKCEFCNRVGYFRDISSNGTVETCTIFFWAVCSIK